MILNVWSYVFPLLIGLVIILNRWTTWPHSWGLGALAQAGQMVMAGLYQKLVPGFWLSVIPLVLFALAWVTAIRKSRAKAVS